MHSNRRRPDRIWERLLFPFANSTERFSPNPIAKDHILISSAVSENAVPPLLISRIGWDENTAHCSNAVGSCPLVIKRNSIFKGEQGSSPGDNVEHLLATREA